MHDRGNTDVVKNPFSFRNSYSLRKDRVAIVKLFQVTRIPVATGSMIQSTMTEWTPEDLCAEVLLISETRVLLYLMMRHSQFHCPLPPLPWPLDLAIYFQQEYCCWFRTDRQKVKLAPTMSLHVGCSKTTSQGAPWYPSPAGSLWDLWS